MTPDRWVTNAVGFGWTDEHHDVLYWWNSGTCIVRNHAQYIDDKHIPRNWCWV